MTDGWEGKFLHGGVVVGPCIFDTVGQIFYWFDALGVPYEEA